MGGIQGRLNQQFAVTIAISVLISAFNALTLSPALSALLLRPRRESEGILGRVFAALQPRVRPLHRTATSTSRTLLIRKTAVGRADPRRLRARRGRAREAPADGVRARGGPGLPADRTCSFPTPRRCSARTRSRARSRSSSPRRARACSSSTPSPASASSRGLRVLHRVLLRGARALGRAPRARLVRPRDRAATLNRTLRAEVPEAVAFAFAPPAIPGIGTAGGFSFWLQDRSGGTVEFLRRTSQKFLAAARKRPGARRACTAPSAPPCRRSSSTSTATRLLKQGVPVAEVYQTLQTFLGGIFVNQFNRFGRQWRVFLQAEAEYRSRPTTSASFYVRNSDGQHAAALDRGEPPGASTGPSTPSASTSIARRRSRASPPPATARAGDGGARGGGPPGAAAGHGLRLGRPLVPGAEGGGPGRGQCSRCRSASCS